MARTRYVSYSIRGYPNRAIQKEFDNAVLINKLNLPAPRVYGLVQVEERTGIVYSRLYGQSFMNKIVAGESPLLVINRLSEIHKEIIQRHTNECMSYKEFLLQLVSRESVHEKDTRDKILELPEGDCLCHGDFHPGNMWLNNDGTVSIIDFMNVCCGPAQYDIARTYYLISNSRLPKDMPYRNKILSVQESMADAYLKNMKIEFMDIEKYLYVINLCRKYEEE